jgi:hypothetical protein
MPTRVICPACGTPSQVEDKYLGQTVRCPRCQGAFPALPGTLEGPVRAPAANGSAPPGPPTSVDGQHFGGPTRELPAAVRAPEVHLGEEQLRPLSLERVPWAWVDRVLPGRSKPFLLAVGGIALGCWLVGLVLAGDRRGFLRSHEWQVQPFFLAVHFICLRLFVTCYTRNFLAGAARMDVPEGAAPRRIRRVLGPLGGGLALLIALPLCVWSLVYLFGEKYAAESAAFGGANGGAAINWFLWLIWCAEWIINAYIWVLLLGFLYLTMQTLWRYRFRAPIDVLLHEKHYRPFLMMSAHGASVVLFFGLVDGFYIWYAEGDPITSAWESPGCCCWWVSARPGCS